jgi:hypothetical protein
MDDPKLIGLVRVVLLALAGAFFIAGGYSEDNTTEFWGWGFFLAVLVVILPELLSLVERTGRRKP